MIRAVVGMVVRAAWEAPRGRRLLEGLVTADPDVGRRLLERLAETYRARLELTE